MIANKKDKIKLRKAGLISTKIMKLMSDELKVGVLPSEIDEYCFELCKKNNVEPAFYGQVQAGNPPFPANCNINVNDSILHAIPSNKRKLQSGDVVKIDFGIKMDELYTDHCYTFIMEQSNEEDKILVETAKLATETAILKAVSGNTTGDLGYTMESIANMAGFEVLKNYIGHGIGTSLWEEPQIPAFGVKGGGEKLREGMVICIESQLVKGTDQTYIDKDSWTIKTLNGEKGAMFEYMVLVGKTKAEILTPMQDWNFIK